MARQFTPLSAYAESIAAVHNGQQVKLERLGGELYIKRPDSAAGSLVGPFYVDERELALNIAADYFSYGQAE